MDRLAKRLAKNGALIALGAALCATASSTLAERAAEASGTSLGQDQTGDHHFAIDQIKPGNVARLQVAWTYETGPGGLQTTPLFRDGRLYVVTPDQQVVALDPASGRELWKFSSSVRGQQPVRGLSYWRSGDERRLFSSLGSTLIAIDPDSGTLIPGFGKDGAVSLRENLGRDPAGMATFLTSPGIVFGDLIIVGFRTSEMRPAAPGTIRAYDVRTGQLRWSFNTIPHPGEAGHETWPQEAWQNAGGANAWAGMALDAKRGIVYVPTGSAVDDFYGGDRKGANLFANSLLALDARTGKRLWHFQTVHHDIWDRDLSSPPALVTITRGGRRIDAVVQPSKQGFLFVLDRVTGKPLYPVTEQPVPVSELPGEVASPTQPFVATPAPFARQRLTADMLTNRTPEAHDAALKAFSQMRSEGPFTPLTTRAPTVVFPGFDGGGEWGGPAIDRKRGILYINSNDVAWTGQLAARTAASVGAPGSPTRGAALYQDQCTACHGADRRGSPPAFPALLDVGKRLAASQIEAIMLQGRGRMPGFPQLAAADRAAIVAYLVGEKEQSATSDRQEVGAPAASLPARSPYYLTGYRKFVDADGYPAVAPPWGTLNAIDLNSGKYLWKIPLGEYPALIAKGMPVTGSENYGGPLLTSNGLLFIGATIYDRKFRAFDSRSGRLLWETTLPYAGVATPTTFLSGGRQYVVIATSSQRDPKVRQGSAYVAFALPLK
ncbi:MAG: pyrroloquinoline quinone-dependent dehydrogenase [Sphingomonadales bacterium]|nr:pyrroloquinoline quinone-dependent dehydrogenase [Sphingomonadales bacterium]